MLLLDPVMLFKLKTVTQSGSKIDFVTLLIPTWNLCKVMEFVLPRDMKW